MTTASSEQTASLLFQYCNAIELAHATTGGLCSYVRLPLNAFMRLASHPLIFDSICQLMDHALFSKAMEGEVVIASSLEEFVLANKLAHRLSALISQKRKESQRLAVVRLDLSSAGLGQVAKDVSVRAVEIPAAYLAQGAISPEINISGKKIVLVRGFVTRQKKGQIESARELIIKQGGQLAVELALCVYDFPKSGIQCLLEAEVERTPQELCVLCNPKNIA